MWPYAMLTPFGVCYALFTLWPIARTLRLSVGHYGEALAQPLVWLAAANTIGFALVFALVQTLLALAAALLIEASPRRLATPLAALAFATHLLGGTFAGVVFAAMLSGRGGLVNATLLKLNLVDSPIGWLTTPALAMPVLIVVAAYVGFGFGTIYLLAALRRADRDLLDAARVDGAGPVRRTWSVTVPQLRPTLAVLFLAAVFWGLQAFELPYVLFGGPGPSYRVLTAAMLVFSVGFERGELGQASAIATLLAMTILIVVGGLALLFRVGREEVTLA